MTLATQMVTDVTDVFLNLTEHAEAFTHQPRTAGSSATTYCGIIEREEDIDPTAFNDGMTVVKRATITTAIDGTATTGGPATVLEGDSIVFDGLTYKVKGRPKRDGAGMQMLSVVCEVLREFSMGSEYRINRG